MFLCLRVLKNIVSKKNYDKLMNKMNPRSLGLTLTTTSKRGKVTDLNGQEFIKVENYLLGAKYTRFLTEGNITDKVSSS